MRKREDDVADVEEKYAEIKGLENPTTLDAKLTSLRGRWKEVGRCGVFRSLCHRSGSKETSFSL